MYNIFSEPNLFIGLWESLPKLYAYIIIDSFFSTMPLSLTYISRTRKSQFQMCFLCNLRDFLSSPRISLLLTSLWCLISRVSPSSFWQLHNGRLHSLKTNKNSFGAYLRKKFYRSLGSIYFEWLWERSFWLQFLHVMRTVGADVSNSIWLL